MQKSNKRKKTTTQTFLTKKAKGEKIAVLTAYDYYTAKLLDQVIKMLGGVYEINVVGFHDQ